MSKLRCLDNAQLDLVLLVSLARGYLLIAIWADAFADVNRNAHSFRRTDGQRLVFNVFCKHLAIPLCIALLDGFGGILFNYGRILLVLEGPSYCEYMGSWIACHVQSTAHPHFISRIRNKEVFAAHVTLTQKSLVTHQVLFDPVFGASCTNCLHLTDDTRQQNDNHSPHS